jgi:preprotein translocase subunit SecE
MNRFRKWVDLFLALSGLALWFMLRQMLDQVWEIFRLPLFSDWPIQLPAVVALAISLAAFALTRRNKKAMTFLDEVTQELAKVTWPNGKETVTSTGVIIVMVGIAAVILFLFDTLWGTLTRNFLAL